MSWFLFSFFLMRMRAVESIPFFRTTFEGIFKENLNEQRFGGLACSPDSDLKYHGTPRKVLETVPEEKRVLSCTDFYPRAGPPWEKGLWHGKVSLLNLTLFQDSVNSFLVLFPSSKQESTFS